MFAWMPVAHLVLPLGSTPAVLSEMQTAMGQKAGLYMFPSFSKTGEGSGHGAAAMEAYERKLAISQSGRASSSRNSCWS